MSGSRSSGSSNSRSRPRILLAVVGLTTIAACLYAAFLWFTSPSTATLLSTAEQQLRRREYAAALESAQQVLRQQSSSPEANWIAGRSLLGLRNPRAAAEHFLTIPTNAPNSLEAALEAANIFQQRSALLTQAEIAWRRAIEIAPNDPAALTGLARLLALAGRRTEAAPLILRLVQLRQPSELLIVLARPSGALQDQLLLEQAANTAPNDPLLLLATARAAEQSGDPAQAADLCRKALKFSPDFLLLPIHTELGRCLLLLDDSKQLQTWEQRLPAAIREAPELARIIGLLRLRQNQPAAAFPLLLDAAQRQPEYRDTLWQLSRLLEQAELPDIARRCNEFLEADRELQEAQDRVLFSENSQPEDAIQLVNASLNCGRIIEAAGWAQLATRRFPENSKLETLKNRLSDTASQTPLRLVQDSANPVLSITAADVSVAVERLRSLQTVQPSASVEITGTGTGTTNAPNSRSIISFAAVEPFRGFDFSFINGSRTKPSRHMYELTGPGTAAVDLDQDGWTDLAITQGGTWQHNHKASAEPALTIFRNLRGQRFQNVSNTAGSTANDFGQGLAAGDLNQDGFLDLVTASVNGARLWINNGDGTLADHGLLPESVGKWITSCAIADLNQDSLPDLFLVTYLGGPDVFSRLCDDGSGQSAMCLPAVFPAVPDLLLLNDGSGFFRDHSAELPESNAAGKGLGILVMHSALREQATRPEILIANDTTPNALLTWDPATATWLDRGFTSGLAMSGQGRAEGCMGIAATDLNSDQIPDLVITNFLGESHAWYESRPGDTWEDRRAPSRLEQATRDVLGFGTCFLDANLDGHPELFIANGHIDNLEHLGRPYRMPAQMFAAIADEFRLLPATELGSWFQHPHIARAAVSLDWNRDHAPDLLVGLLHENSTLLSNTSPQPGKGISLTLVSQRGERHPVGARSAILLEDETPLGPIQQLFAGHGYQSSADTTLIHGCGPRKTVPTLRITWPTGISDAFHDVETDSHYILIEGRSTLWTLPR
jgi:Flp pilus assembly protein TadD